MKSIFKITTLLILISFNKLFALEISDLQPIGGEVYQNSTTYTLIWSVDDTTSSIDLILWDGNSTQWDTIATDVSGTITSYDWVPDQTSGTLFRLKAVDHNDSNNYIMSTTYFTIEDPPQQYTSVENNSQRPILKVYPNPTFNQITIKNEMEPIDEIFIWNSMGDLKTRRIKVNSRSKTLELHNYPNGTYYVEVVLLSGLRLTTKIILLK